MIFVFECLIFVICDLYILNLIDEIYKIFKLEIINFSNFIINLDEICRSIIY